VIKIYDAQIYPAQLKIIPEEIWKRGDFHKTQKREIPSPDINPFSSGENFFPGEKISFENFPNVVEPERFFRPLGRYFMRGKLKASFKRTLQCAINGD